MALPNGEGGGGNDMNDYIPFSQQDPGSIVEWNLSPNRGGGGGKTTGSSSSSQVVNLVSDVSTTRNEQANDGGAAALRAMVEYRDKLLQSASSSSSSSQPTSSSVSGKVSGRSTFNNNTNHHHIMNNNNLSNNVSSIPSSASQNSSQLQQQGQPRRILISSSSSSSIASSGLRNNNNNTTSGGRLSQSTWNLHQSQDINKQFRHGATTTMSSTPAITLYASSSSSSQQQQQQHDGREGKTHDASSDGTTMTMISSRASSTQASSSASHCIIVNNGAQNHEKSTDGTASISSSLSSIQEIRMLDLIHHLQEAYVARTEATIASTTTTTTTNTSTIVTNGTPQQQHDKKDKDQNYVSTANAAAVSMVEETISKAPDRVVVSMAPTSPLENITEQEPLQQQQQQPLLLPSLQRVYVPNLSVDGHASLVSTSTNIRPPLPDFFRTPTHTTAPGTALLLHPTSAPLSASSSSSASTTAGGPTRGTTQQVVMATLLAAEAGLMRRVSPASVAIVAAVRSASKSGSITSAESEQQQQPLPLAAAAAMTARRCSISSVVSSATTTTTAVPESSSSTLISTTAVPTMMQVEDTMQSSKPVKGVPSNVSDKVSTSISATDTAGIMNAVVVEGDDAAAWWDEDAIGRLLDEVEDHAARVGRAASQTSATVADGVMLLPFPNLASSSSSSSSSSIVVGNSESRVDSSANIAATSEEKRGEATRRNITAGAEMVASSIAAMVGAAASSSLSSISSLVVADVAIPAEASSISSSSNIVAYNSSHLAEMAPVAALTSSSSSSQTARITFEVDDIDDDALNALADALEAKSMAIAVSATANAGISNMDENTIPGLSTIFDKERIVEGGNNSDDFDLDELEAVLANVEAKSKGQQQSMTSSSSSVTSPTPTWFEPTWEATIELSEDVICKRLGAFGDPDVTFPLFSPSSSSSSASATTAGVGGYNAHKTNIPTSTTQQPSNNSSSNPFDRMPMFLRGVVRRIAVEHVGVGSGPHATVRARQRLFEIWYLVHSSSTSSSWSSAASSSIPPTQRLRTCFMMLRADWLQIPVCPGDVVHLVAMLEGKIIHATRGSSGTANVGIAPSISVETIGSSDTTKPSSVLDPRISALIASTDPSSTRGKQLTVPLPMLRRARPIDDSNDTAASVEDFILVDEIHNAFVIHPDILLSPTRITSAGECVRRAVLQELMGDAGGSDSGVGAEVPLLGSLKHALFEHALVTAGTAIAAAAAAAENASSGISSLLVVPAPLTVEELEASLYTAARAVVHDADVLEDLYACEDAAPPAPIIVIPNDAVTSGAGGDCGATTSSTFSTVSITGGKRIPQLLADKRALQELNGVVAGITDWMARFVLPVHQASSSSTTPVPFRVAGVVGTEDSIWSPVWGIKGIVDATVDVELPLVPLSSSSSSSSSSAAGSHFNSGIRRGASLTTSNTTSRNSNNISNYPSNSGNNKYIDRSQSMGGRPAHVSLAYDDNNNSTNNANTLHGVFKPSVPSLPTVRRRIPLELKTGKRPKAGAYEEHRAQMLIYALLMQERYSNEAITLSGSKSNYKSSTFATTSTMNAGATGAPANSFGHVPTSDPVSVKVAEDADSVGGLLVYLSAAREQALIHPAAPLDSRPDTDTDGTDAAGKGGVGMTYNNNNNNNNNNNHHHTGFSGNFYRSKQGYGNSNNNNNASAAEPPTNLYTATLSIAAMWLEQRSLLVNRNTIAVVILRARRAAIAASSSNLTASKTSTAGAQMMTPPKVISRALPAMIQDPRQCSRCSMFAACATMYAARELPEANAEKQRAVTASAAGTGQSVQYSSSLFSAMTSSTSAGAADHLYWSGHTPPAIEDLHPGVRHLYEGALGHMNIKFGTYMDRWMRMIDWEAEAQAAGNGGGSSGSGNTTSALGGSVAKTNENTNILSSSSASGSSLSAHDDTSFTNEAALHQADIETQLVATAGSRSSLWRKSSRQQEDNGVGAGRLVLIAQVHQPPVTVEGSGDTSLSQEPIDLALQSSAASAFSKPATEQQEAEMHALLNPAPKSPPPHRHHSSNNNNNDDDGDLVIIPDEDDENDDVTMLAPVVARGTSAASASRAGWGTPRSSQIASLDAAEPDDAELAIPDENKNCGTASSAVVPTVGGASTVAGVFTYTFCTLEAWQSGGSETTIMNAGSSSSSSSSSAIPAPRSLLALDISVGDWLIGSGDARGPYGLLAGAVTSISSTHISVRGDRNAFVAFPHAFSLPSQADAMAAASDALKNGEGRQASQRFLSPFLWRVDRDEVLTSSIVMKDNIVRLLLGRTLVPPDMDDLEDHASSPSFSVEPKPSSSSEFLTMSSVEIAAIEAGKSSATVFNDTSLSSSSSSSSSSEGLLGKGDVRRQRMLIELAKPRFFATPTFPWSTDSTTVTTGSISSSSSSLSTHPTDAISTHRTVHFPAPVFPVALPFSPIAAALQEEFTHSLNDDQRAAVTLALRARDYACILGMPGTGKTATTGFLIRCLVALGKSVLVTSHTHTAVDNLLLKVAAEGVHVLRIGRAASVHPDVNKYCLETRVREGSVTSLKGLHQALHKAQVVGTTCLGIRHVLFARRTFDVCIVDEAGQIPEPIALGPLRTSRAFVLIGDHYQLPPLVVSPQAKAWGMDISLFRRLAEAHPQLSVVALTRQYRMNEDIQTLSNALIYEGELKCGNEAVATRKYILPEQLRVPNGGGGGREGEKRTHSSNSASSVATFRTPWLPFALSPDASVLFLDTDSAAIGELESRRMGDAEDAIVVGNLPPTNTTNTLLFSTTSATGKQPPHHIPEAASGAPIVIEATGAGAVARVKRLSRHRGSGGTLVNKVEAAIVAMLVQLTVLSGGSLKDIGIISPYRSQLKLLRAVVDEVLSVTPVPKSAEGTGGIMMVGSSSSSSSSFSPSADLEIETVDRFQGRDKPFIIMSLVRSNTKKELGNLLTDIRRLNVAFSRAKAKLILVGSSSTLSSSASTGLGDLFVLFREKKWIYPLPLDAHTGDMFGQPYTSAWKYLECGNGGPGSSSVGSKEEEKQHHHPVFGLLDAAHRNGDLHPPTAKHNSIDDSQSATQPMGAGMLTTSTAINQVHQSTSPFEATECNASSGAKINSSSSSNTIVIVAPSGGSLKRARSETESPNKGRKDDDDIAGRSADVSLVGAGGGGGGGGEGTTTATTSPQAHVQLGTRKKVDPSSREAALRKPFKSPKL